MKDLNQKKYLNPPIKYAIKKIYFNFAEISYHVVAESSELDDEDNMNRIHDESENM